MQVTYLFTNNKFDLQLPIASQGNERNAIASAINKLKLDIFLMVSSHIFQHTLQTFKDFKKFEDSDTKYIHFETNKLFFSSGERFDFLNSIKN